MHLARWTMVVIMASSLHAAAGDFGVREFAATVNVLEIKQGASRPDRWAAVFGRPGLTIEETGPICVITLQVTFPGPAFRKANGTQVAFANERACATLRRQQRVHVQTMGLADFLHVVSISIDGVWFSLPRMRQSAVIDDPWIQACLKVDPDRPCAPLLGTTAL